MNLRDHTQPCEHKGDDAYEGIDGFNYLLGHPEFSDNWEIADRIWCPGGREMVGVLRDWCDTHDAPWKVYGDTCVTRWGIDNHYMNTPENTDEFSPHPGECVKGVRLIVKVEQP